MVNGLSVGATDHLNHSQEPSSRRLWDLGACLCRAVTLRQRRRIVGRNRARRQKQHHGGTSSASHHSRAATCVSAAAVLRAQAPLSVPRPPLS